jgi:hypothetical protein
MTFTHLVATVVGSRVPCDDPFRASHPLEEEDIVANRSDLKLAILSILLSMEHTDDLERIFTHALHLNKQRNRERAAQLRLSFDRDDS